jgi:hypothetical protein
MFIQSFDININSSIKSIPQFSPLLLYPNMILQLKPIPYHSIQYIQIPIN